MKRSFRVVTLLVACVLLLTAVAWNRAQQKHEAASQTFKLPSGGDFTLQSAQGPVSLSDFRGKLVILFFGYTFCPDICPTALGNISVAWRNLSPQDRQRVQVLFVSVDPERDTPARLKAYVDYFAANIVGLTGSKEEVARVAKQYGAVYYKVPVKGEAKYLIDHSAYAYFIGRDGRLLGLLNHGTSPMKFKLMIEQILRGWEESSASQGAAG